MARSSTELLQAARGRSLTAVTVTGLAGILLAASESAIESLQAIVNLAILAPASGLADFVETSIEGFLTEPINVIVAGAEASAASMDAFGFLGLPVGVGVVLLSYMIVATYLNEDETTDVPIPGLMVDVIPFVGVEEEDDAGD